MPRGRNRQAREQGVWGIHDDVTALRRSGSSEIVARLPASLGVKQRLGAATLHRDRLGCWIAAERTWGSLRRDGVPMQSFLLTPGVEVGLDNRTFIVESPRLGALGDWLGHLIGVRARTGIDRAVQVVRHAMCNRRPLVLCGDRIDVVATAARRLHELAINRGEFVICGASDAPASTLAALASAAGGTVCIMKVLPSDLSQMLARWHAAAQHTQLMWCLPEPSMRTLFIADALVVTPLDDRPRDRGAVVDHYVKVALDQFGAAPSLLSAADLAWIGKHERVHELETAAMRLVAFRRFGVTMAAAMLGVTHGALSKYLKRREMAFARGERVTGGGHRLTSFTPTA